MSSTHKAVLITGCSTGIGHTVALGLQGRGYDVYATCRKPEDVEKLRTLGLKSYQLDLTDKASIQRALDQVLEDCDHKLYALFNNGAYGQPGALEDLSTEVLKEQFETNFFGWHELTRHVLPVMRAAGEGRIIQNSSVLGYITLPFRGAYNSSKFAIEGWTDTLRIELQLNNTPVHVSLIEPGPVTSRFRANAMRMFKQNVTIEGSAYESIYRGMLKRLEKTSDKDPFTLPPEAVLDKVIHALESPKPNPRYYVTIPSYLFGYLKRMVSTRVLDKVLLSVARKENG